jgi:hypothetical protein
MSLDPPKVGNPTDALRIGKTARKGAALQFKEGTPMSTIAAAQTADRTDYWIPPHIIQYCYGTYPSQLHPRGGRRVGMLAIGKCLKNQYDTLATPMPRHLAVLVNQLEMQK